MVVSLTSGQGKIFFNTRISKLHFIRKFWTSVWAFWDWNLLAFFVDLTPKRQPLNCRPFCSTPILEFVKTHLNHSLNDSLDQECVLWNMHKFEWKQMQLWKLMKVCNFHYITVPTRDPRLSDRETSIITRVRPVRSYRSCLLYTSDAADE